MGNDRIDSVRIERFAVYIGDRHTADGICLEPVLAVSFSLVIGPIRVDAVSQARSLHKGSAGIGGCIAVGQRLRSRLQSFQQLSAAHVDHSHLVGIGQDGCQLRRAELADSNVGAQIATVPEGNNVIGVHIYLGVAGGHIVLVKIRIDLAGHGEPPQRVGPQIAQIGLRLTGRVVRAGQHHAAVSLQRVIQFQLIAVGIHELGCGHGRGHHAECKPQRQHKADKSVSFFHSFLPK